MKKILFILILGALCYGGYSYYKKDIDKTIQKINNYTDKISEYFNQLTGTVDDIKKTTKKKAAVVKRIYHKAKDFYKSLKCKIFCSAEQKRKFKKFFGEDEEEVETPQ